MRVWRHILVHRRVHPDTHRPLAVWRDWFYKKPPRCTSRTSDKAQRHMTEAHYHMQCPTYPRPLSRSGLTISGPSRNLNCGRGGSDAAAVLRPLEGRVTARAYHVAKRLASGAHVTKQKNSPMRSCVRAVVTLLTLSTLLVTHAAQWPRSDRAPSCSCAPAVRVADFGSGGWWAYDRPQWSTATHSNTGDAHGNFKHAAFDSAPLTELIGCVGAPLPKTLLCDLRTGALPSHCVRAALGTRYASAVQLFSGGLLDLNVTTVAAARPYLAAWSPPASSPCGASAGGINVQG